MSGGGVTGGVSGGVTGGVTGGSVRGEVAGEEGPGSWSGRARERDLSARHDASDGRSVG